jgi:hypothetical protein
MNEDDLPVTDDQQPSEDDIKEVFAYFGSAYYYSECLHGELCNAYAIIALKDQGYIIRPRFEEMIAKAFSLTLGKLIAELIPHMPEELGRRMKAVLEQRNFLAHHFWYERCHLMTSIDGNCFRSFTKCENNLMPWTKKLTRFLSLFTERRE